MASTRTNIEQERAAYAYTGVKRAKDSLGSKKAKEYKAYSKKVPMLIKTSGLGAAIAFMYSKGFKNGSLQRDTAYGVLYQQTEHWLQQKGWISQEEPMINAVIARQSKEYRAITNEIFALYNWLRRFAEGMIEGEAEEN
ncbi:MAG: type III-B CRISPR module-associated protein Cmr5 [Lewinellaceae bacterium]|nr:type III-B CRISPR module-associated protein Cmr5 [Lewinellaceae bacterium]